MKRIVTLGVVLVFAGASRLAAQDGQRVEEQERDGTRIVEGLRKAKITLADAVSRAARAVGGDAVSARLDVERTETGVDVAFEVIVLKDGILHEVEIDATNGDVKEVERKGPVRGKGAEGTKDARLRFSFEDVPPPKLPRGFDVAETNGEGTVARWQVEQLEGSPSGRNVLSLVETLNSGSTFNLLLSDESHPADLEIGVKILARSGDEDQGGGLVWRAKDAGNYYVTRWNPLENNLRAYKVVDGRRTMLVSARLEADPSTWHTIGAKMKGSTLTVTFDGKQMLSCEDTTFSLPGRIGLWTKADAACSFDDLEIEPLESKD